MKRTTSRTTWVALALALGAGCATGGLPYAPPDASASDARTAPVTVDAGSIAPVDASGDRAGDRDASMPPSSAPSLELVSGDHQLVPNSTRRARRSWCARVTRAARSRPASWCASR